MGIVGLPNGKSTLLTHLPARLPHKPPTFLFFCTIEPNVGDHSPTRASTPRIAKSKSIIPTRMTFVDIAARQRRVQGGPNQFLANIRKRTRLPTRRCFEDGDVTHVEGRVDPVADAETIDTVDVCRSGEHRETPWASCV
jgi:ribosome-binding ATPase YchF (GTP1/OBG family)